MEGDPFYRKFWVRLTQLERKRRFSTDFSSKIALCLKKVCYKVSLCGNCQRQSCRAFIGLTNRAKMIGGDVPFYMKIWRILTHP